MEMNDLCLKFFSGTTSVVAESILAAHESFWILLAFALIILFLYIIRYVRQSQNTSESLKKIKLANILGTSSPVAMMVVDLSGRVVQINSGFEKMLGYEFEDIAGRSVFTFLFEHKEICSLKNSFSGEEKSFSDQELLSALSGAGLEQCVIYYLRRDGTTLPVNIAVHALDDNENVVVGYMIAAGDLSENYRIQRELENSRRFLRSVLDAIPMRIFWKDPESNYVGCNKAFALDAGLKDTNDIIGMRDSQMPWGRSHGADYVAFDREVLKTRQQKSICQKHVRSSDSDASMIVRTTKLPLRDANEEVIGVLGMYEDVTDFVRMQEIVEKRIVSLTRYMDDPDALEFDKLFDIDEIQKIQDEFSESTRVSSVIVGSNGEFITRSSRMSSLCKLVMNSAGGNCENCYKLCSGLVGSSVDGPVFRVCPGSGLTMAVSPIVVGGVHVASWILGQVLVGGGNAETLQEFVVPDDVDPVAFSEAYNQVPLMTEERFDSVAETAHILCAQLSLFAEQNIQQARLIGKEKERVEELRRYDAIIQQIPDGVVIIGKDQRIQYANPAFTRITGYSQEEAAGMSTMLLSSDKNSTELLEGIVSNISKGKVWTGRLVNKHKDGTIYTGESVISPFFDENGKIVSAVATMRDITEELAREEQMYHRQKMAAVGQLAGGIAHDFNNILQAVLGFSELLMKKLPDGSSEYRNAEQICSAAKRAAALTRGLLSLGRKEQSEAVAQVVDVNFMLNDSFIVLNLLSSDNIEIIYNLAPDLPPVKLSQDKFYQVIVNLVINARDAMPDGGSVTISTENVFGVDKDGNNDEPVSSDFVKITIEDCGCGIPEEARNRIFNPFYTTKDVGKGSGLGLAIVYVIIEDCGGKISFESKTGEGTKFFVYLPIQKV